MFDAKRLLGAMMEARSGSSAGSRLDKAAGSGGLGEAAAALGQMFKGSGSAGTGGGLGGALGSLAGMARSALDDPKGQLKAGNPVATGGLGALAGGLFGGRGGALGGGLLAVLGTIAYSAMQKAGHEGEAREAIEQDAKRPGASAVPVDEAQASATATLLIRAMVSAAKADGQIDGTEMQRILGHLDEAGVDPEERNFVLEEMRRPVDIEALAADARSPALAAELYAASLLAIEVDTEAERAYLQRLARTTGLAPEVVSQIHRHLDVPEAPATA
ncbi:tellurite resistance TerB family protein [Marinimicrococcus flavescens]|uniref:Tellurite resistance TerB family protein n=1 Tax=Marinimicrococcus flavescens TaxID=3031815 RepID=A0AAP3UZ32_9PROT|nr:tellurite resistance TerB family protein [Marinimicrococcus flavescens]